MVSHLALVLAEEAVTAVVGTYPAIETGLLDKLKHLHKLFVA